MAEWFEDEQFWRDMWPFMFPSDRLDAAREEVESLTCLTGVTGGRVLDLCSGPGRHSVELAERGFLVTGVDRTPFLMEKARERAAARGVEVEWVQSDMRDFRRDGEFDLALSMFTSFGYFESEEEDLRVLSNVYGSLKPGGVFVMETMSKERLARIFLEATCREFEDGTMLVERHSVTGDWSRASNEWMIVRGEAVKRYRFSHTVYSGRELRERLEGAGFAEVMLYGNLEGAPYDQDATRLVIVARKH